MEKNDVLLNDLFNGKKQNLNKKTMVDNFCFNPENTIKLTKEEIAEIFNDNINPENTIKLTKKEMEEILTRT